MPDQEAPICDLPYERMRCSTKSTIASFTTVRQHCAVCLPDPLNEIAAAAHTDWRFAPEHGGAGTSLPEVGRGIPVDGVHRCYSGCGVRTGRLLLRRSIMRLLMATAETTLHPAYGPTRKCLR
jgi:hypothetical protein